MLTPDVLKSFPDVTLIDSHSNSFQIGASILSSVSRVVRVILEDHTCEDTTIVLSGFSETFAEKLYQLTTEGELWIEARDEKHAERRTDELRGDFNALEIPVPEDFWHTFRVVPLASVKVEFKEEEVDEENAGSPKKTEFDPDTIICIGKTKGGKAKKVFRCCFCKSTQGNNTRFTQHVKKKHKDKYHLIEGPFTCKGCARNFIKIGTYFRHVFESKNCATESVCEICGTTFPSKGALADHIASKHEVHDAKCDICGKEFKNMRRLKHHIIRNHGTPKQCEQCPKTFMTNEKLKLHILSMHTENDLRPHICQYCGKGFAHKTYLKEHVVIHTRAILFPCRVCNYETVNKHNRNKHEKQVHKYAHVEENCNTRT